MKLAFTIVGVILIALIVGVIIGGVQLSHNINKTNLNGNNIATLQGKLIVSQWGNIIPDRSIENGQYSINCITNTDTSTGTQISALQTSLSSADSQLKALATQLTTFGANVQTLQNSSNTNGTQISSIQSQVTTLQSSLTTLQSTVNSLNTTVSSLSTQINNLSTTINSPVALLTSYAFTQSFGTQTTMTSYTPNYSGYLNITGSSSSATSYIRVNNNNLSTYTDYTFGTGTTINAAVTSGYNYSVIFGNSATTGTINATISVTYSPNSTSNSVALLTSYSFTQSHGTATTLTSYTPSYTGYFSITGSSNSTTSYVRVTNNTQGTYTDYTLGTGTTLTASVTGGKNYSIIFGNSASSGTISATVSVTYYH